jgi:hypothetical protein
MAIAIPKVTQYITKSRKDSLVTTSKDFINAVRNDATSEMFDFPIGVDDVTIISLDLIKLEKGGKKSSFNGAWLPKYSYVAVINVGTDEDPDYEYYISVRDSKRYNIALTEENELRTKFTIISDKILYVYVLGAQEIRNELRAKSAEKKERKKTKKK